MAYLASIVSIQKNIYVQISYFSGVGYRDLIVGHKLEGMDAHYLSPDKDTLKIKMEQFTQWLDGQLNSVNVDQTVDQSSMTGN